MPDTSVAVDDIAALAPGSAVSLYGTFPMAALNPTLERLKEVQVGPLPFACRGRVHAGS